MKKIFFALLILSIFAQVAFCAVDPATGDEIKGYKGNLPNLESKFENLKKDEQPEFESVDSFKNTPANYKPVPYNNPDYVNVIVKKEKKSEFANDMYPLIDILEKVINSINNKESEQLFAARANYLYENAEYIKKKYLNKPEQNFPAYSVLINTSSKINYIVTIRKEAKTYSAYLPYQTDGYMYNPEYIDKQLQNLLADLNNIIKLIKEVN